MVHRQPTFRSQTRLKSFKRCGNLFSSQSLTLYASLRIQKRFPPSFRTHNGMFTCTIECAVKSTPHFIRTVQLGLATPAVSNLSTTAVPLLKANLMRSPKTSMLDSKIHKQADCLTFLSRKMLQRLDCSQWTLKSHILPQLEICLLPFQQQRDKVLPIQSRIVTITFRVPSKAALKTTHRNKLLLWERSQKPRVVPSNHS